MATSGDDDVIENMNTSNEGAQAIELTEVPETTVDSKEINGGNSHSNLENNMASSEHAKQNNDSKPLLPKIFIALLVVLLIAVIALSFVLYHLDQGVEDNHDTVGDAKKTSKKLNDDLTKVNADIAKLVLENKEMVKQINELKGKKDLSKNITMILSKQKQTDANIAQVKTKFAAHVATLTTRIHAIDEKIQEHKGNITALQKHLENNSRNLTAHGASIGTVNGQIVSMKADASHLKGNITALKSKVTTLMTRISKNIDEIASVKSKQQGINKKIASHSEELKQLREFQSQLHLDMHYEKVKDKIKITFQGLLDLIGKKNIIGENNTVIDRLVKQVKDFEQYQNTWKISYADVLRLTDGDVLKGDKDLPTVKKIAKLCKMFEGKNKEWNITFKDVIRLTTKEDMKVITVTELASVSPPVLQKIGYLYTLFNTTWRQKWGIQFKDIIDERITTNLNFTVGDEDAPPLKLISSWYVTNFTEIWGDSFKEFFVVMRDHPSNRKSLLKKVTDVSNKGGFLRFLQAKFVYAQEELSVQGYIEVILSNIWGTIWNPKIHFGGDSSAEVLCRQAGYNKEKGVYSNGIYNTGTVSRSLVCLVSQLQCYGQEENVTMCRLNYNTYLNRSVPIKWKHDEDVGIKCTF